MQVLLGKILKNVTIAICLKMIKRNKKKRKVLETEVYNFEIQLKCIVQKKWNSIIKYKQSMELSKFRLLRLLGIFS
jgi:hypothetical protein